MPQDHGQHPRATATRPGRSASAVARPALVGAQQRQARSRASCSARSTAATSTFRACRLDVSAAARVDRARRRHLADEQQADARLRPALGLLLAVVGEERRVLVLRSRRAPTRAPAAGPGRLAFAGDGYGAASYGARYPEKNWYGGFAPRLGAVYSLNDKTVIRSGWGIFYTQAFYPGWGGGISQDGFSQTPRSTARSAASSRRSSWIRASRRIRAAARSSASDYKNGQGILYRPIDAQQAAVLAPVERHGRSRARQQLRR